MWYVHKHVLMLKEIFDKQGSNFWEHTNPCTQIHGKPLTSMLVFRGLFISGKNRKRQGRDFWKENTLWRTWKSKISTAKWMQKFQQSWKSDFPWVIYRDGAIFCTWCVEKGIPLIPYCRLSHHPLAKKIWLVTSKLSLATRLARWKVSVEPWLQLKYCN